MTPEQEATIKRLIALHAPELGCHGRHDSPKESEALVALLADAKLAYAAGQRDMQRRAAEAAFAYPDQYGADATDDDQAAAFSISARIRSLPIEEPQR